MIAAMNTMIVAQMNVKVFGPAGHPLLMRQTTTAIITSERIVNSHARERGRIRSPEVGVRRGGGAPRMCLDLGVGSRITLSPGTALGAAAACRTASPCRALSEKRESPRSGATSTLASQ